MASVKLLKYFLFFLLVVSAGFIAWHSIAQAATMTDNFESYANNFTIQSDTYYVSDFSFPTPTVGTNGSGSSKWVMDTGSMVAKTDSGGNKWGYLSVSSLYRLNTTDTTTDTVTSFTYKASGTSVAMDVWLREQTQYWLYAVQYDRSDGCIVVKRKIPYFAGTANHGVYYELNLESGTRPSGVFACNHAGIKWTEYLGPSTGTTSPTHDGTLDGGTTYNIKATITTIAANTGVCTVSFPCAEIKLYRGGALVATFLDKNDGFSSVTSNSEQTDCDAGFYTSQTGYQTAWCRPIVNAGVSGIRNDDALDTWIDNFSMTDAAAQQQASPTSSVVGMKRGTLKIKGGRIIIK